MVAHSPRFAFLATLCALAALTSAPVSDAAVLGLRASDPALANMAPGHWFRSQSSPVADHPVLPLPKSPGSSGNKNDEKVSSAGGSHGGKDVSASDGNKGSSSDDDDNAHEEGGKIRVRIFWSRCPLPKIVLFVRIGPPLEPVPIDNATEQTLVWW